MEQASTGLLRDSRAGVDAGRYEAKEPVQEPGLTGAHEACEDSNHIPQIHTARLQSLVNDLLSSLITEGS